MDFSELGQQLSGDLCLPGDDGWEEGRKLFTR